MIIHIIVGTKYTKTRSFERNFIGFVDEEKAKSKVFELVHTHPDYEFNIEELEVVE